MGGKSTEHINEVMNDSVSSAKVPAAMQEAERLLEIKRNQLWIDDESFIGNPYSLLGRVIEVRSKDGKCNEDPRNGYAEFSAFPIPDVVIDEQSKIRQPLRTKAFIVDKKLSTEIDVLSMFNSKLDAESLFSVIVHNQAVGLLKIQDKNYYDGMRLWMKENQTIIEDPDICHLLVVTGMVQKNVISKKYKKFDIKNKGGAYGINVNGALYTSADEYSLDIRFGLSYLRIPIRRKNQRQDSAILLTEEDLNERLLVNKRRSFLLDDSPITTYKNLDSPSADDNVVNKYYDNEYHLLPNDSEIEYISKVKFRK